MLSLRIVTFKVHEHITKYNFYTFFSRAPILITDKEKKILCCVSTQFTLFFLKTCSFFRFARTIVIKGKILFTRFELGSWFYVERAGRSRGKFHLVSEKIKPHRNRITITSVIFHKLYENVRARENLYKFCSETSAHVYNNFFKRENKERKKKSRRKLK